MPSATDDVVIGSSVTGPVTLSTATSVASHLVVSGGNLTVAGTAQVNGQLDLEAGSLDVSAAGLSVLGGQLNFDGAALAGGVFLANATLNVGPGGSGAAAFTFAGASTLEGNVASDQTLWVQGDSAYGDATLTTTGDVRNSGSLLLQSMQGGYHSNLVVADTLTNASTGTIDFANGDGGDRHVYGNLVNLGTVSVEANVSVVQYAENGVAPEFDQEGGSFTAENGGRLTVVQGSIVYSGGTTNGATTNGGLCGWGSTIDVQATAGPGEIDAHGADTLLENASPLVAIHVDAGRWDGNASLDVVNGAVNAGTIVLESAEQSSGESDLVIEGTLTNTSTGTIDFAQGNGGNRQLDGHLVNQGSVLVDPGVWVTMFGENGAGPDLDQQAGTIVASGTLVVEGGELNYTGGDISGAVYADNATLDVADTVTATSILDVTGGGVLVDNASPTVTLQLLAGTFGKGATLTTAQDAVNAGTLTLQSSDSSSGTPAGLVVAGDSFTNTPSGQIVVNSSGGQTTLAGTLVNEGSISLNSFASFTGTLTNAGSIWVGATAQVNGSLSNAGNLLVAGQLQVQGTGPDSTVTQTAGTFTAAGTVVLDNVILDFQGGAINGGGDFQVNGSTIAVGSGVTAASQIEALGGGNVLLDNASAATTIWVRGTDSTYATLQVAAGATDAGVLLLESSGWWGEGLALDGTLDVKPGGVIELDAGAGTVSGGLIDEGLIEAADGDPVQVTGNFVLAGGRVQGPVYFYGATLSETADPAAATTLTLQGADTLLTDNLDNVTLAVQGSTGGAATLTIPGTVTNDGAIELTSVPSGWGASLQLPTFLVNVGQLEAVNGSQQIDGSVVNFGTVSADAGAALQFAGTASDPPTLDQEGGQIQAAGQVLLSGGNFDFEAGALGGNFVVRNTALCVSAWVADPATIQVLGTTNTLESNDSTAVTLEVESGGSDNQGVLTTAAGAENAGTILLQPASANWGSYLVTTGPFYNFSTGVISATAGAGGGTAITGDLENAGTVLVGAGAQLTIQGGATAAALSQ